MYRKMLIPTDGEAHSQAAVEVALVFAKATAAQAIVCTVFQPIGALDSADLYNAFLKEKAQKILQNWEQWGRQNDIHLQTRLIEDEQVSQALVGLADDLGCDLIAMGTHGREGIARMVLGSVAERVLRLAKVPVLLLRFDGPIQKPTAFPKCILVALDGGAASELALEQAIHLASGLDAALELVYVVPDVLPMWDGLTSRMYDASTAEAVNQRFAKEGEAILARGKAKALGLRVGTTLRHALGDRIAPTVLNLAAELHADLICMGTHGYTGFERLLLGSVAEGVAHHAKVPVLLVRPQKADQPLKEPAATLEQHG